MQPGLLALIVTILPFLVVNAVFIISAYEGNVPWCNPYIDGCTTISQAARSGNSIYLFRPLMMAQAVLLIWLWIYARQWLDLLHGERRRVSTVMMWMGIIGAVFLMLYIDFLGTKGEFNYFMRRFGIIIYFTFTPFAQLLLLRQHYLLDDRGVFSDDPPVRRILNAQTAILLLILVIGITSLVMDGMGLKTYEVENIVEWNIALLMTFYFGGLAWLWRDYKYKLSLRMRNRE